MINSKQVNQRCRRARTKLLSAREDKRTCNIGKAHAIWEPPGQKLTTNRKYYDKARLLKNYRSVNNAASKRRKENPVGRAIRVAGWLGMGPLGWMFLYADDDRHEDGRDAALGATL